MSECKHIYEKIEFGDFKGDYWCLECNDTFDATCVILDYESRNDELEARVKEQVQLLCQAAMVLHAGTSAEMIEADEKITKYLQDFNQSQ